MVSHPLLCTMTSWWCTGIRCWWDTEFLLVHFFMWDVLAPPSCMKQLQTIVVFGTEQGNIVCKLGKWLLSLRSLKLPQPQLWLWKECSPLLVCSHVLVEWTAFESWPASHLKLTIPTQSVFAPTKRHHILFGAQVEDVLWNYPMFHFCVWGLLQICNVWV